MRSRGPTIPGTGDGHDPSRRRDHRRCDGRPGQHTGTGPQSEFFVQEDFEEQLRCATSSRRARPIKPWVQALEPEYVDTSRVRDGPALQGLLLQRRRQQSLARRRLGRRCRPRSMLHAGDRRVRRTSTPRASDEKQISDIQDLLGQDCNILIVSPNTTAALTPAVEQACEQAAGDRLRPRRQHRLPGHLHPPDRRLRLRRRRRRVPGRECRSRAATSWRCASCPASTCWRRAGRRPRPSSTRPASTSSASSSPKATSPTRSRSSTDYIERFGTIDGVWMDAGATASARSRRSRTLGLDVPPITGEDQQDFLRKWKDDGLTAVAPTYPTYQWRTPIIAAVMILKGEEVPKEWMLPQPLITSENLDQYLQPNMPPLHYALCGCENMPGLPGALAVGQRREARCQHLDLGLAATDEGLAELRRISRLGLRRGRAPDRAARRLGPGRTAPSLLGARARRRDGLAMTPRARAVRRRRDRGSDDQAYLRACVDLAAEIGAGASAARSTPRRAGPGACRRTSGGRSTRPPRGSRRSADHAGEVGVRIGVEPLKRYETSIVNTVEQALEAIDASPGAASWSTRTTSNIEERDPSAPSGSPATMARPGRQRSRRPGADHFDWRGFFDALRDDRLRRRLVIESFTAENQTIATAAAIWRPLAPSQDAIAIDGLAFLRELLA